MRESMKRKGQHLRAYHGWYVWVWMMGGVAFGELFLPWQAGAYVKGGPILIGFLTGWLGGFFHGAFMLDHFVEPPTQPDTKADV